MTNENEQINLKEHIIGTIKKNLLWLIKNPKFILFLSDLDENYENVQDYYRYHVSKRRFVKKFKSPLLFIGILLLFSILSLAVFESWVSSYELAFIPAPFSYAPPSPEHPFGQTFRGLDVLARMIYGVRYNLIIIFSSTLISIFAGIFIGAITAYYEGWIDIILMRLMDVILSFPGIIFAILFLLIWGHNIEIIILVYAIIETPYFSRIIRTSVLTEKNIFYVDAARAIGAKNQRIIFRHILPNCIQPILVSASLNMGKVLLSLTVLSFLGLADFSWIQWGSDIFSAINRVIQAPWATYGPLLMIIITVVCFLLIGDGLRDVFALKVEYL